MRQILWKQLLAALMFVTFLAPVIAQKSAEAPVAATPDFSKEAYTIERLTSRITAESDGTGSREVTAEVKILADAGVKAFAVLSFTYTSANETVDIDYVRVHKPDGSIVHTPDYNVQDMPAEVTRTAPLYSDIHEKHVAVKGLAVGDTLEYLVRYRVVKPEVPGQFWYEYSFVKNAIAKDERLEISIPNEKHLKVVSPEFKPEVGEEGQRRVYRWKSSNLTVQETDPNEVPRRTPPNPDVQVTTFASWGDVGNWYKGLQKDSLQVTPAIQAKAAELTKGLATDEDKIHALYNFVSLKYHYVGLDFGIGRYQPHAADDVLDNGYGDCKDKHTLLASLLQAVGIEAWPVLIHSHRKLDPDVPSPAQFNHVITVVPRGTRFIWLDTTPEVSPYELILLTLRNKQALVIPVTKPPLLMTTPENPPFPQEQEFSMAGKLTAEGTFSGHAEQSYRGDVEVMMRAVFREIAQSQWKEAVQRVSYGLSFGGDVSNVKITPPDELDKPFAISYDYVRKKYGDWDNHQITPPLPPMGIEFAKDSRVKKPLEPVLLGAVGKVSYHSRIELPAGFVATPPAKCYLAESFAEFSDETRIENGVMTTTRELVIKKSEIPLSDWEGFHKFGRAVSDDEFDFMPLTQTEAFIADKSTQQSDQVGEQDVDALFDRGRDALQRRDGQRAQELFEKVIAKDPKRRGAHLNLGIAMMTQNRPNDALAEFHKEQEISPNDPQSFQLAAAAAGFTGNNDEAAAELRKLLSVDPRDAGAATTLGGLLSEQGKYPEAVEVLEAAVKATPDSPGLQFQLGTAHLQAGHSVQAVSHLQKAAEQNDSDPMMLNNVAYTLAEHDTDLNLARQYAEKALEEIEDRSIHYLGASETAAGVAYQLSLIWDTVGWAYFQSGDTNRSEGFVRSAWLLGQDAVVGEHLGEIYEKQGKNKAAAKVYELALAAVEAAPPVFRRSNFGLPFPAADMSRRDTLTKEITARYQKLTGKKPSIRESLRLPNGEWTKTAAEQLTQLRTASLGKLAGVSGSAEFTIVFMPGKTESVEYASGDKSLEPLMEKIKAHPFQVEFPVGSEAKLFRRAQVGCYPTSGCTAVLIPVSAANARNPLRKP
jgi:tetratricopeptide (TPR) repeat protein/transglutaminase-like putative cysteine protease